MAKRKQIFLSSLLLFYFVLSALSDDSYFEKHQFHKMKGNSVETSAVYDDFQCMLKCKRSEECSSINLADKANKGGLFECVFLRHEAKKYGSSLKPSRTYHHYASVAVYCDQKTNGGGWTVIQRRQDGSVDFYRGWNDYKKGFGDLTGEFWLGLDKIYQLTKQSRNRLRVELEDWDNNTVYAEYDYFAGTGEKDNYLLSLGNYKGTAGDSLFWHRGMAFTTKDRDNDKRDGVNCAVKYKGAWWYNGCHHSNLNGLYHHGQHDTHADGVNWKTWRCYTYSAKRAEMKIRPV